MPDYSYAVPGPPGIPYGTIMCYTCTCTCIGARGVDKLLRRFYTVFICHIIWRQSQRSGVLKSVVYGQQGCGLAAPACCLCHINRVTAQSQHQ